MPTILRIDKLRFVICPNDHTPAHVHVIGADWEAVVDMAGPELREIIGGNERDGRKAVNLVAENIDILLTAWRQYHG